MNAYNYLIRDCKEAARRSCNYNKTLNLKTDEVCPIPATIPIPEGPFQLNEHHGEILWEKFALLLANSYSQSPLWKEIFTEAQAVFEMIVMGDNCIIIKDRLKKYNDRILIILGGADTIFRLQAVQSFSPKATGLCFLQVPRLGHFLSHGDRKEWLKWKDFVTDTVLQFCSVTEKLQK